MTIRRFGLALLMASSMWAQGRGGRGGQAMVSPEILADGRVTFRVQAPKATEVTLTGDWLPANTTEKLTRDGSVWSVTLGPFAPTAYIYSFNIDGVAVPDPVNPRVKLRARTAASIFEVPARDTDAWKERDIPHGTVELNYHQPKTLAGQTRTVWVYTPPGYDKDRNRRYPVLYLFHGNNDTAGGWTLVGNANFILDNLIHDKKAVPMIIVMPWGHAAPFGGANNNPMFEDYVLKDVMPTVEAKYRVASGRQNRAIAGLSMGGGQSLSIGFGHLDLFSAIGAFSAAIPGDFETKFAALLKDAKGTNDKLKLFWFACGRQDSLFARSQQMDELMTKYQIKHTWRPSDGWHNYANWRLYLSEMAPLLFR